LSSCRISGAAEEATEAETNRGRNP